MEINRLPTISGLFSGSRYSTRPATSSDPRKDPQVTFEAAASKANRLLPTFAGPTSDTWSPRSIQLSMHQLVAVPASAKEFQSMQEGTPTESGCSRRNLSRVLSIWLSTIESWSSLGLNRPCVGLWAG